MDKHASSLTVLFESPFWIGIYERESSSSYEVCKITFGAEPKDYEVYDFIMKNWAHLRFSPAIDFAPITEKRINPKRIQREVREQLHEKNVCTKAQQALNLQREQGKLERNIRSREQRELEKQLKFEHHQEKQKERHRGH